MPCSLVAVPQRILKCARQAVKVSEPVFGEVQPHVLHEVADVSIDICPVGLLRHNARNIA